MFVPEVIRPQAKAELRHVRMLIDGSDDWLLAREEIFGPVLVAIPWRDEADAIRMANDSHYGLAAYVWTTTSAAACARRTRSRAPGSRSTRAADMRPAIPTAVTSRAASVANSR
jgi:hypothetical protein